MKNPRLNQSLRGIGLLLLLLGSVGCKVMHPGDVVIGRSYQPENIYLNAPALPAEVKRVAVLPMMTDERVSAMMDGRDVLGSVLILELLKTKKFEVVPVTPEILRVNTGKVGWTGEEVLPDKFLSDLHESSGCDAVLFCQLTTFRAYAPLAVGWRMKLVDVRSRQVLWAGDELFDAGQAAVKNGARRYQREQLHSVESGGWVMDNSPRFFGQYTLAKLLDTLPER